MPAERNWRSACCRRLHFASPRSPLRATEKLTLYWFERRPIRVSATNGAGTSRISGQSRTARWSSSITRWGSKAASQGRTTPSLRTGDGALRLMMRDFATTLLGTVAMSLPGVRIWTERQLIWITSPSTEPSSEIRSPMP